MRCLRKNDALCRGTIASIVLLLAQCIGGDDGAGQAVCREGDMRAECGMTLVVHQPGKSLLPFVADEVKMRKRDMCLDVCKYTSKMTLFNTQNATRLSEKRGRKRERRGEIGNKGKGKVETNTHARTTARMYARNCHACVRAHRHKHSTNTHTHTHTPHYYYNTYMN